ncbi:uncharacterized protein LOC126375428 [Pectinophora gossypiella]|uniref:Cilia- and flagella-associated protein 97 n=1 Tax=Pectinophora gossypiella TaxID=13191 RepID=A0A1E1WJ26_PECGO|nr:uncharacterized protein LOC126375428 [Pectinophora gossypiella]XP_049878301.1 uncharacterized protein LOC126375428 [Pectinophora gossypiella]XP_049878302.1 uncharacterized protein LOC126375428 [Pectinophora gossypiella]XP_049878303.1 uncharacterized protein LOC126375428 [Pectinophora gossypiella]XP_049878304.1 uncharacterized protein LOC126375428 [Pectinophora gossypiella]
MSSRRESKVEQTYIDTEYSSGDSNKMKCKQRYQEENNNELAVDELSKDLQMGCIVDAVKRPPNICVETCVYEESDSDVSNNEAVEEDAYSDEFEDYNSDGNDSIKMESKSAKSETVRQDEKPSSSVKLSKSHSFMSSKPNGSVSGKSGMSGKSSTQGSLSVPRSRRINMSFSNERLREIERHNHILLNKILSARNHKKSSIPPAEPPVAKRPQPAAAMRRKKQQREIDHENMILLRKIQRAKSTSCSLRR